MDNPVRTAAFHALQQQRRNQIREFFETRFPGDTKLVWEVGCGHGHFLAAFAQAHPDQACIGIDISSDRIARAERKRLRSGLPNLHFLQAEALLFLDELPANLSLSAIFILFPDPWPKLRHQKHRIFQPRFLREAASRASADCRMYFRTDYRAYYLEAARHLATDPSWCAIDERWPFEFDTVFQQRAPSYFSLVARRRT